MSQVGQPGGGSGGGGGGAGAQTGAAVAIARSASRGPCGGRGPRAREQVGAPRSARTAPRTSLPAIASGPRRALGSGTGGSAGGGRGVGGHAPPPSLFRAGGLRFGRERGQGSGRGEEGSGHRD
ncbi:spidroin-1-like [Elephas maximus indicus]|uniref:spidroin-1-like n=1 Tax=Elephas maximus indicus TaxID=99487 RepID=UPI002116E515|nr:spidroin-1-like [Elephas maximus indicus]